ncbi:hypothetical protein [Ruminiclostridium papyrosolvens]|uniref:Uncharacterized protein n=1 Tax=Ruminiclostridium papyrosolvens C7 TaxID=1330534 RepID=U4QZ37_9FIRM|nr:hypothetical protein [Ruminiclostridium papyrosolvens]EPR10219.1 hypothetical protein L323_14435 [Ruminiclostridium papyrosolvens C7]
MNKYNFEPSTLIHKNTNTKYDFTPSKESKETNKKTDNTIKNVNKILRFNKEG